MTQTEAKKKVEIWCKEVSYTDNNLFVERLLKKGFNYIQIAEIIDVMGNTCRYCFDNDWKCQCWNDE